MKMRLPALLGMAGLLLGAPARAAGYAADPAHSSVNFTVRHIFSKVNGQFKEFSGRFVFDEKSKAGGAVEFAVKVASIDTNEAKRDEHLRGPDFFDAAKFPEAVFKSTAVSAAGGNRYKVSGDLTLRGVTRPVTFDSEFLGAGDTPWGKRIASFSSTATIRRKDFGMVWNKVLDSGALLIGDEVQLLVEVEGIKQAEEAGAAAPKK